MRENPKASVSDIEKAASVSRGTAQRALKTAHVTPAPKPKPEEAETTSIQTQQQQRWTRKSAAEKLIMRLKARIGELEALLVPLDDSQKDELARYKRQVDQEFKRRWKLAEAAVEKRHLTMTRRNYGLIFAGFHPEASTEKRDAARNLFVKLCEKHVIHDKDKVKWPPTADEGK